MSGQAITAYINGVDNSSTHIPDFEPNATTVNVSKITVNQNVGEIDYFVIVPDALTETQMQSVYNDYNEDIEGFLSANNLTPTVKYTFENDNTNTGTAVGLPPISFQTPDVYTTAGTKFEIPSVVSTTKQITNYSIQANRAQYGGTYFSPTYTVGVNGKFSFLIRFKTDGNTISTTSPNRRYFEISMESGGFLLGSNGDTSYIHTLDASNNYYKFFDNLPQNSWNVYAVSFDGSTAHYGMINDNVWSITPCSISTELYRIWINESGYGQHIDELDYLVIVPNALTEASNAISIQ